MYGRIVGVGLPPPRPAIVTISVERPFHGLLDGGIQTEFGRARAFQGANSCEQRVGNFVDAWCTSKRRRQSRGGLRRCDGSSGDRGDQRLIILDQNRSVLQHGSLVAPLRAPNELASVHDQLPGGRPLETGCG